VLCAQARSAAPNLIINGNFAKLNEGNPLEWGLGPGGTTTLAGPNGERCLKINSPIRQYSVAEQYLTIDGSRVRKVRFQGHVRFADVRRGIQSYDVARAFIMWFDGMGRQVGDYCDAGMWTGSSGWTSFSTEFEVPETARRAQIIVGLHECSGTCWFADLGLYVTAGDTSIKPSENSVTDTHGWWAFTADESPAAGTAPDVSWILDAPAGKHGFVTARNGHFYFQDGTPARFWGFDITGPECFPDHATADVLATRLARMGANIVRMHHLDASWSDPNMFDRNFDDTRHLSAESLDRFDYFLAQMKKRGIYIYFDWLVNRHFKKGDGVKDWAAVDDGAKIVAHFDPKMIRLEKEYMRNVLNHRNKYTGIRYADEPQIALSEVINEDSVFYEDWYYRVPSSYMKEFQSICRKYDPKADPAHQPFTKPTLHALYAVESGYYREMRAYLKKLGLKCPTTGSNHWENMGPALACDSETDYIDRHYYWDHPKDGYGWWQEFDNLPELAHYEEGMIQALAGAKIAGKPFVVTEWCNCWVNDHIAEGPLVGATYACLQDWDVMIWFDITHALPNSAMENEFDISNKPHLFAQWAAASLMFHRRDVTPLTTVERRTRPKSELLDGAKLSAGLDPYDALTRRIETSIQEKPSEGLPSPHSPHPHRGSEDLTPDTRHQIPPANWNEQTGTLTVKSPRTLAVDGFLSGGKPMDFGWVRLSVESPFCAIWLTSLDGLPLTKSHRILLTAASRAENTGMKFNSGRTHLVKNGDSPVLVEPVVASLTFDREVTVRPLAQDGTPGESTHTRRLDLGNDNTFWYEIAR